MSDKPLTDYNITDAPSTGGDPFATPPNNKKKPPSNPNRKAPGPLPPWREGAIAKWCTDIYTIAGNFIVAFDPVCGNAVLQIAEPVGKVYEKLAKQDNAWRRFFGWAMSGSTMAELVMAHAALGVAIMTHHGPFRTATENMAEMMSEQFKTVLDEEMNGKAA
ncbi:MAG: hypothetical protein ACRDUW_03380 [Pseudonocardiaceae bacterium]